MGSNTITIDREKCVGCGLCAKTCHQSAIAMVDGKAMVVAEEQCDGLGNCLPVCPVNAIQFSGKEEPKRAQVASICPGKQAKRLGENKEVQAASSVSALAQWPVQIKLVPENAPYFANANLLVAADCAAYAYANFHAEFMKNKVTIIGCPKLDEVDYTNKLLAILQKNTIQSVSVVRMEVPCCGGIERAVKNALKTCGKMIPWQVVTLSVDGCILSV